MKSSEVALQRLLRSAARGGDESPVPTVPFGFDTRVVALWRANRSGSGNGIAVLVRRVAVMAACILVISGVASFRELLDTRDSVEPTSNEFAIADSAIDNEFYQ
jgi:hypothetical protein